MKMTKEQHDVIELLYTHIQYCDNLSDVNDIILNILQSNDI